jgi:hypothetical protein
LSNSSLTDEQKEQIRYWIHTIGCDLVACITKEKKPIEKWSDNLLNAEDYDIRLEQGLYDNGVAIKCGQIRHGKYASKYISVLDFDTLEASQNSLQMILTIRN